MNREDCLKLHTPSYLFDLDRFHTQIREVREAWEGIGLCYSIKANPFLVGKTPAEIDWLEVCSPGELEICREKEIDPSKIIFSGVNKNAASVTEAFDYGVSIFTAESRLHAELIRKEAERRSGRESSRPVRMLLRLSAGSQFGMSEEDLLSIVEEWQKEKTGFLSVSGIHFFSGTQKKRASDIEKELAKLQDFLDRLKTRTGFIPETVEYGTGLGVEYFRNGKEPETDSAEKDRKLLKEVTPCLKQFASRYPLTVEMGRFFAADCGCYMTEVADLKTTGGIHYVICDGGIHQLKYQGQTMGMHTPEILVIPNEERKQGQEKDYCICGSLCTTADLLVRNVSLPELAVGDRLLFLKTGAYSVTEGLALFLSRELPAVYFKESDRISSVRPVTPTYTFNI